MADCQALQESSGYNEIADLINRYDANLPSLYVDTQQQYDSVKSQINRAISTVNNYRSRLDAAIKILVAGGCSALLASRAYGQLKYWQEGLAGNLNTLNTAWDAKNNTIAASEKASTTKDNAGNGTPGSAGASGATGATGPSAVSPATVAATGATGATGLQVGATGPKPVPGTSGVTGASGASGSTGAAPAAGSAAPYSTGTSRGLSGATEDARAQANRQDAANYALEGDWRVRLALAPGAQYLYDLPDNQASGILAPLRATDGVIFPYTPTVNITYAANYEPADVVHSNYKIWQYRNSSVDNVSITADFTAQDTHEANYLLAVIHFFRTVTKMFYGKDQNPKAGTPPPLCYLYGLGQFQFNMHPLLISNFTYVLPPDVDYIRATTNVTTAPLVNKSSGNTPNDTNDPSNQRLSQSPSSVAAGGVPNKPTYSTVSSGTVTPTYVPTKIQLTIQAHPIVARNDISQAFSLKDYATGKLLVGKDRPGRGGVW